MPQEGSEEGVDPLDVAATTQRPALDGARARRVVRAWTSPPPLQPDATSEVQVEDILLEVYAEESPPTRRSPGAPARAASSASVVPPAPAESAAVDALLRASDPAILFFGGYSQSPPRPPTPPSAFVYGDHESPSVAPVAFPSMSLSLSAPLPTPPPPVFPHAAARPVAARRPRRAVAVWTALLLVVGVAAGTGVAIGVRNGTYAQLRDGVKAAAARARSTPSAPAVPPVEPVAAAPGPVVAEPARAPVAAPVVAPAAAAPAVPNVSVDSLPPSAIPADSSLVTFPVSAQGHRVFFDGRPMAVTSAPMQLRCGRHMIRMGSTGKARVTDLACGREVTLVR